MKKVLLALCLFVAMHSNAQIATHVVISEVYGGGGNTGAIFINDFIELYNPTSSSVSLSGWSVQYASATGNFTQVTNLSGSIPAKSFYLVQEAAGTGGTTSLPTPAGKLMYRLTGNRFNGIRQRRQLLGRLIACAGT